MNYVVHYRLDDRAGTPGKCRTDYPFGRGEVIYAGGGRAVVRSCRPDTDRPHPQPLRTQHALARMA